MFHNILDFFFVNLPALDFIFITILVIFIGGLLRGFLGFGPALLTIPVLAYIYSPTEALVIHIIMEIPSTLFLLPTALKYSQKKATFPLFISMIIFIPVGMYLVVTLDPQIIRRVISVIVLFLVILLSRGWNFKSIIGFKSMVFSGILGGFIQGIAGIGGAPIVTILMARNDSEDVSRGNILLLMAGIVVFSITSQAFYGLISIDLITLGFMASPIYIAATYFGSRFYSYKGKNLFRKIALFFLSIIALTTFLTSF